MTIPAIGRTRSMLEHCLEFSDRMDPRSANNGLDSLYLRRKDLDEILGHLGNEAQFQESYLEVQVERVLHDMAIELLLDHQGDTNDEV